MSFGGKFNYGKEYAKYKPNQPDSIFEQYVEETPDLLSAWNEIESDPQGTQGSYWGKRGATSKAAFGRAHAAEDFALSEGTYRGGTDVSSYSEPTRFESFFDLLSGDGTEKTDPGPFSPYTGDNTTYPVLDTAYTSPAAPSWAEAGGGLIPDAYAPWSEESLQTSAGGWVPQNIWEGDQPITGLGKGVTYTAPRTGPITIPVPEAEGTSGGTSTTDAQGNKWTITPGGQWVPAGSDYANALAAGNAFDPNFYDSSGAWVGAEGTQYDPDNPGADIFGLGAKFDAVHGTGFGTSKVSQVLRNEE